MKAVLELKIRKSILNSYYFTSVVIATRLQDGQPGFDSLKKQDIFLFCTVSRPVGVSTQLPLQWIIGGCAPVAAES
jgi:hypothetical protein